jgi:hypothetical protein
MTLNEMRMGESIDKNVDIMDDSFEAFTEVMFQVEVFWVVTPCSVVVG